MPSEAPLSGPEPGRGAGVAPYRGARTLGVMNPKVMLVVGCAGLLSAAALVGETRTQEPAEDLALTPVAGGVGVLQNNFGGNVGVLANAGGSLIVDTNLENFQEQFRAAFDAFAGDNPRFVVNTHWHEDHTGNNVLLGGKGVPIVGHEQMRRRLVGDAGVEGRTGEGIPPAAYPTITYDDDLELHVGDERVVLRHYGPGHTDGDGIVWFQTSKVLHMGDMFFNGMFPYIDLGSGGNVRGYGAAVAGVLADLEAQPGGGADWRIIPGHGEVCGLAELKAYHGMLSDCIARVEAALEAGQTMEQLLAGEVLAGYEDWSWRFMTTGKFIEILGTDLAAK